MSENPVEKMVRDFQDRIVGGAYAGIYGLREEGLEHVMECQASACASAYAELYQIPADLDLDALLARLRMGGSSKIEIERDGNRLTLRELHSGRCVCPLVTREVIPLEPGLCRCAEHWVRKLLERHVVGPVRVQMLESAALGHEDCVFRVEIEDTRHPQSAAEGGTAGHRPGT